jgi:predicted TPR repeat methyltransferase
MAIVLLDQCRSTEAHSALSRAVEINPDFVEAWRDLANLLASAGKTEEAIECYGRVRDIEPAHPDANHMLAALTGETTKCPPEGYVKNLFDSYASTYETQMLETLAYRVPRLLHEELDRFDADRTRFDNVIDLGCGTGLCGDVFGEISGRILGIDLSSKMIAEGSRKNIYDSLELGDMTECLREKSQTYDLFLSADVFIYVGGLEDIFSAVRARARPEALFAFSVEALDGDGFELLRTGRYAHSRNYIEGLAATHDFTIGQQREIVGRQDHGHPIDGFIYVLKAGKSN